MSFRELRNFTEQMRALGYSRMLSVDSFRTPNFELVADILEWLVRRFEPNNDLVYDIATETDRVHFLKEVAKLMASRGRIKLNAKRLYQADGYAVKELLKISNVLYSAVRFDPDEEEELMGGSEPMAVKLGEIKSVREYASEITGRGATIFDLLQHEIDLRDARQRAISRDLELSDIERSVKAAIASLTERIAATDKLVGDLEADEKGLDAKIERRRSELERHKTRFRSLQEVRPSFMDEYEKLEEELQDLFRLYVDRFRNLDFLEHKLAVHESREQEIMEEKDRVMKRMQRRLKEEEYRVLRGEQEVGEWEEDADGSEAARPATSRGGARVQVEGSLLGGSSEDESDSDLSDELGSDESMGLSDGDSDELIDEDELSSEPEESGSENDF